MLNIIDIKSIMNIKIIEIVKEEIMQNQDYISNLATAVANGMSLVDFYNYCKINDITPCDMTLKFFLNESEARREGAKC